MIWSGDIQDTKLIALNRDVQSKPTWYECPHIPDTEISQRRVRETGG